MLAEPLPLQVSCFPGLSECLAEEVRALGLEVHRAFDTGIETEGSFDDVIRMNLWLRTALNVRILVGHFKAGNPDELYGHINAMPWEQTIDPRDYLSVTSQVETEAVDNSMFASLRVKDAIVDRIASVMGARPDSGPDRSGVVVDLFWKDHRCWLYVNTSGRKLADRGYRRIPHKAPLREVLAAGIMQTTAYDGSMPLVTPMCGSGTLAIEAALIGAGRAPGLLRDNFALMHIKQFGRDRYEALRREARSASSGKTKLAPIIVSDIDPRAVEAARKNAATAGVDHLMEFHVCDFADTPVPPGPGIVVANPEYGERLGEVRQLEATYKRLGDFFKQRCPGYTAYIFTGNLQLAKKVGLKTSRRIVFHNASIECRLLKYEMYRGTGS